MGQISYEAYNKRREQREAMSNQGPRVGYFSLKNDGDEAIVRIMHDSTADFDMVVVHPTVVNGKRRNVACLRSPEEPIANCPFCAADKPIRSKIYIHLIEYSKDQNGNIIATPRLWERSASYAVEIASKIETYGPLSDCLFKVKRHGAAGSINTLYTIDYAPPTIYLPELYVKDTTLFENVKALGTAVFNKTPEQMQEMLMQENGAPAQEESVNAPETATTQSTYMQPAAPVQPAYQPTYNTAPTQSAPVTPAYQSVSMSTENTSAEDGEIVRPRRYY